MRKGGIRRLLNIEGCQSSVFRIFDVIYGLKNYGKIMVFSLTFPAVMPYIINRRLPRVERVGQPIWLPVFLPVLQGDFCEAAQYCVC